MIVNLSLATAILGGLASLTAVSAGDALIQGACKIAASGACAAAAIACVGTVFPGPACAAGGAICLAGAKDGCDQLHGGNGDGGRPGGGHSPPPGHGGNGNAVQPNSPTTMASAFARAEKIVKRGANTCVNIDGYGQKCISPTAIGQLGQAKQEVCGAWNVGQMRCFGDDWFGTCVNNSWFKAIRPCGEGTYCNKQGNYINCGYKNGVPGNGGGGGGGGGNGGGNPHGCKANAHWEPSKNKCDCNGGYWWDQKSNSCKK
ncbi:hypothetical protein HKX48_004047 [Thoreauomyces humboldtii]|nr:hypothetical protein HKX48_004047 [Thoreauomyces humboldtii]